MAILVEQIVLLAVLLGVGSHLGYFIHGEHHASNLSFFLSMVFGPPILYLYFLVVRGCSVNESLKFASIIAISFAGSLTVSILTYRYFFHRLRHYPGPAGASLSKLWQTQKTISRYRTFELLDELHARYGDIVRTGPNELSIIHPDVVDAVYGPQSKCKKAQWYDMSLPITSLQQIRDRALHDRRRRSGWDKAFSTKSIRTYDDRVVGYADDLLEKLDTFCGRPTNVAAWFSFYSHDVMGSLGFGTSFNTLKTGGAHKFTRILYEGSKVLRCAGCVVWLCNLCAKVPGSFNPITQMNQYSEKCVQERKKNKSAQPDILGHLIESEEFFGDPALDHMLLLGDSRLVIIAGSDTTAAALVFAFYYIAKDPAVAQKIRDELRDNGVRNDDSFTVPTLQTLPYLNGVIHESLRLHPPVPGGVFRMTPPEGLKIGDQLIPGDINILVPTYSLQRSPKNFVEPNSFLPERWTSKPGLVINKNALMPFSAGPYSCIGKQLAMGEIRTVIAKLLVEFDVTLAPNETGDALFRDLADHFTLQPGKLELCFIRRGQLN